MIFTRGEEVELLFGSYIAIDREPPDRCPFELPPEHYDRQHLQMLEHTAGSHAMQR